MHDACVRNRKGQGAAGTAALTITVAGLPCLPILCYLHSLHPPPPINVSDSLPTPTHNPTPRPVAAHPVAVAAAAAAFLQILEAVQRLLNLLGPDSPALYPLVLPLLQYSLNANNPEVGGVVGGRASGWAGGQQQQ